MIGGADIIEHALSRKSSRRGKHARETCCGRRKKVERVSATKIWQQYHMFPVMSSAPSGRLRALSAYSLRGLSPGDTNRLFLCHLRLDYKLDKWTEDIIRWQNLLHTVCLFGGIRLASDHRCKGIFLKLTVHSMEGVGLFFVGGLWSADDLQHGALWLGGLRWQRIIVWVLLSVCLWTANIHHNQLELPGAQMYKSV